MLNSGPHQIVETHEDLAVILETIEVDSQGEMKICVNDVVRQNVFGEAKNQMATRGFLYVGESTAVGGDFDTWYFSQVSPAS